MGNNNIAPFIREVPKAELHVHIEGTLEPELMFGLAARNNIVLPFPHVDCARKAYRFSNLQSFLDIYYQGTQVLLNHRDFYELTWEYLLRAPAENIKHVEISFDPQSHTVRGVPFADVIGGIQSALEDAQTKLGVTSRLIMCFLRHLSAEDAFRTLEQALPYKNFIVAVGLDSSETGHPPSKFKEVFERAQTHGFITVAHAGEEGPPEYIWEALDWLKVSRIDHGVRCLEDPKLVERLAKERIPLTVCPLSNLKLAVVCSLDQHPLNKLLKKGLCATVNSDDPAYFGGYITDNYLATAEALKLTCPDLAQLAKNSFEAAFLCDADKHRYQGQVDALLAEMTN